MESGIEAPPPSSLLQNINSVISGSPSAPMDSNNGSPVVANSLSLPTSSSPLSRSLSMPSTLSSSVLLTAETSQDRTVDLPLGSEGNVTLGSQDDCSAPSVINSIINSLESAQSQQEETITSDVIDAQTTPSENSTQATTTFIPTLRAWAKPLLFKPLATPPEPSTPQNYDPTLIGNQLAALWPSLTDEILNKKPKSKHPTCTLQPPIEKLPPPELKPDGSLRFPWAARLSPQSRNLYRAATPTYRLDGTPEVSIPSKVLKPGPENKDEYIIGKFHRCSLPPGGLVHAVVNRIWGRSCKISCKKLGESSFMFRIPHEPTRHWVIQSESGHVLEEVRLVAVLGTLSPSSHSQQEKPIVPLNSVPAYSTLVDGQSNPTYSQIMETSPSSIINNKVLESSVIDPLTTSTNHCAFESPSRFTVLEEVDEAEIELSNSFSLTRGGRGNRGRRGRGSYH
ncbi:hypothetical protein IGI04_036279 [Brassica rapa subsp. trilocularis]|uniref:DUF4283 domain-containing protein n=1 Tax=Brassica rapa subsp. trilocularis TaxID=1813537 RepID=A0ABQ7LH20_BRACM|nr:hypothetical protein IGI04_036279 [Brassica rapa subsp. trilocularis]